MKGPSKHTFGLASVRAIVDRRVGFTALERSTVSASCAERDSATRDGGTN
jgi:hypothetical protein